MNDALLLHTPPITCEFEGKDHKVTYWIAGKIPTVVTGLGGKSKQLLTGLVL